MKRYEKFSKKIFLDFFQKKIYNPKIPNTKWAVAESFVAGIGGGLVSPRQIDTIFYPHSTYNEHFTLQIILQDYKDYKNKSKLSP